MQPSSASPLKVLDLGVGMAAALAAKMLAEFGAEVSRIEVEPDPFYQVYPAYAAWRRKAVHQDIRQLDSLLAEADICLVGGEDFPGFNTAFDAAMIAEANPRLVVVDFTGYVSMASDPTPAVDILVQARLGMTFEQFEDHPVYMAMPMPTYGAAIMGLVGGLAALIERETSGLGQRVGTSLQQGAALYWNPLWMSAEKPDGEFDKVTPKGAPHLIFRCSDEKYIQFALGTPGAVKALYGVLGIDVEVSPNDRGMPRFDASPLMYFADRVLLEPYVARMRRDDLVKALQEAGLAAEPVLMPGEAWTEPQVIFNGTIATNADGSREVGTPIRSVEFEQDEQPPRGVAARSGINNPPLAGLRVLDLGTFVAGPLASRILADLGAEVIKVEPIGGNPLRAIVRHTRAAEAGKRSICLDTKSSDGSAVFKRLAATADAVHYNYRVGVAARLGYDPAALRLCRQDVVTLQTYAYGSGGPKARLSGLDMVMQALCGIEHRAGGENNPPLWYRSPTLDYGAGGLGAAALLHGLLQRIRQGGSVELETSLLDAGLFMLSELVQSADGDFTGAPLLDAERAGFHPAERLYRTEDGYVAVAARSNEMAARLAATLNLHDMPDRAEWANNEKLRIAEAVASLNTDDLLAKLKDADVWATSCERTSWVRLSQDAAARKAKMVIDIEDPQYGTVACVGPLVAFSRSVLDTDTLQTQAAGADTRAILVELGLDSSTINDLYERGVVA